MSVYKATPEQYIDLVTQGIHAKFKAELKKGLKKGLEKLAAEIVEEVAEKCAASMTARVAEYNNTAEGTINLQVHFNYKGDPPCPSK